MASELLTTVEKAQRFASVVEGLKVPEKSNIFLIGGPPGSHKSSAQLRLTHYLKQEGVPCLSLDIDHLLSGEIFPIQMLVPEKWQIFMQNYEIFLRNPNKLRNLVASATFGLSETRELLEYLAINRYGIAFNGIFNAIPYDE